MDDVRAVIGTGEGAFGPRWSPRTWVHGDDSSVGSQSKRSAHAFDQDRRRKADWSTGRRCLTAGSGMRGRGQKREDEKDEAASHLPRLRGSRSTRSEYAEGVATRADSRSPEQAWLLRALLVLQSPRSVFAALRDDSDEAAGARQEAAGALVWLAGVSGVLATSVTSTLLDDPARDWLVVTVWAFLAGGLQGFVLYFVVGKVMHVALRKLGSRGSFRRARHLLAFAAAPIALALLLSWPLRIGIYGEELFRYDGNDGNAAGTAFAYGFYGFVLWALALLVIGVRTVHGWSWARSLAGVAFTAAIAAALAVVVGVLYALG